MKKAIITVLALVLYCTVSIGQDTCRNDYRITTLPFQFIFNDYNLTFEKVYNHRRTLGLSLGFRPSTKNEAEISSWGILGSYTLRNFWNPLYNAFTIGLNSKYYFSKFNNDNRFIEGVLYSRFWWFNNKNCTYKNIEDRSWSGVRTERQNVYGLKILLGNTFGFKQNRKTNRIIDLYYGIGLRYKRCKFETINGTFDEYLFLPYKLDIENSLLPSLHLGLRIGLGLKNE